MCKVELKGPAAGGAAAPFRYAAPVLALAAGVTILGYDQFLIIPTRGFCPLPPADKSEPKMHQKSDPEKDTHF